MSKMEIPGDEDLAIKFKEFDENEPGFLQKIIRQGEITQMMSAPETMGAGMNLMVEEVFLPRVDGVVNPHFEQMIYDLPAEFGEDELRALFEDEYIKAFLPLEKMKELWGRCKDGETLRKTEIKSVLSRAKARQKLLMMSKAQFDQLAAQLGGDQDTVNPQNGTPWASTNKA